MDEVRYASRMLLKQRAFTAIAILTFALGIGANTAIFSVVNAVLVRPPPYPDAEKLIALRERSQLFEDLSVILFVSVVLAGVAFVACWLPGFRASQVDPVTALRSE